MCICFMIEKKEICGSQLGHALISKGPKPQPALKRLQCVQLGRAAFSGPLVIFLFRNFKKLPVGQMSLATKGDLLGHPLKYYRWHCKH